MANALKEAPSKKTGQSLDENPYKLEDQYINQEFDVDKKYMFELVEKNPERESPVFDMNSKRPAPPKEFKPYQNIVLSSQIVWKGQRVNIRYYDGCDSIFVADQPKDKDIIDQLIRQTSTRAFLHGKFGVHGDERMLLLFLNICSWNGKSPFRTRTADTIFIPTNQEEKATIESEKLDKIETAFKYAREATDIKMLIHAKYLNIPVIDYDSGNELSMKAIRTAYRKKASEDPFEFIESYGNKSIEVKYYIDQALEKGLIKHNVIPNKATWGKSDTEICDISGLKSPVAVAEKLFEFSQLEEGEEFVLQLKALFN